VQHDSSRSDARIELRALAEQPPHPGSESATRPITRGSPALAGRSLRPAGGRARKLVGMARFEHAASCSQISSTQSLDVA
jgi:hypothetical protein